MEAGADALTKKRIETDRPGARAVRLVTCGVTGTEKVETPATCILSPKTSSGRLHRHAHAAARP